LDRPDCLHANCCGAAADKGSKKNGAELKVTFLTLNTLEKFA
jgi:hypothetical protein